MAYYITEVAVKGFANTLRHVFQQGTSLLLPHVTYDGMIGEDMAIDFVGKIDPIAISGRLQDTELTDPEFSRRWVTPVTYAATVPAEQRDMARMLADPRPSLLEAMRRGFYRKMDYAILAAADAAAKSGKAGSTTTSYSSSNTVAVGAANITLAKIGSAKKILRDNDCEIDYDPMVLCLGSSQEAALIGLSTLQSEDYVAQGAIKTGKVPPLFGFTPVVSTLVGVDSSSYRKCFFWMKSAMEFRMLTPLTVTVNQRPDKNNLWQLQVTADFGAVRTQEAGVGMILCAES